MSKYLKQITQRYHLECKFMLRADLSVDSRDASPSDNQGCTRAVAAIRSCHGQGCFSCQHVMGICLYFCHVQEILHNLQTVRYIITVISVFNFFAPCIVI